MWQNEPSGRKQISKRRQKTCEIARKEKASASDKTYAKVLGAIRAGVKPEESGTEVRQIRKTFKREILSQLNCCKDRGKFEEALKLAVGGEVDVKIINTSIRLEILDLDSLTTENEIKASTIQNYEEQV